MTAMQPEPDMTPHEHAALFNYASEVGGEYLTRGNKGMVLTRVDNWTIVAEGGS